MEALKVVADIDRGRLVLAFVDVIMEHDTAGLELVGKLRAQFGTPLQIVLNTGQPHLTPAEEAARKYEISGYLSKLEATPERLRTVIHVAIRNFRKFRAMQVLCDSLSDFVTLFESATSTKALDKLLSSALLQYGSVWQFSYILFRDLFAPDVETSAGPREKEALQELLGLRIHATGVFSRLRTEADQERWGIVIKPLGGRFEAGLAIDMAGRPSEVLIRELQVLLRSWALTRESIELKLLAAEDQRLREVMYRERRESIAQMVAGVAHEINTPLGVANAAAATLSELLSKPQFQQLRDKKDFEDDMADVLQGLNLIQKNIARADTLVRTFRHLSVGQLVDKREELDIRQCVQETIQLWSPQAQRSRITVKFIDQVDANCVKWIGYAGHLSQIILNLLTNASRYAYADGVGGPVDITLTSKLVDDRAHFTLEVRDHGAGIPKENMPMIFEPFFTTGRGKGGTGLGLSIVQNLVISIFGGTIKCESEVGKGTAFIIDFTHCREERRPEAPDYAERQAEEEQAIAVQGFAELQRRLAQGGQLSPEEQLRLTELRGKVDGYLSRRYGKAVEEFVELQRKLAEGKALTPEEQMRLADVRGVVDGYLAKKYGGTDRHGNFQIPVRKNVNLLVVDDRGERTMNTELREISTLGAAHVMSETVAVGSRVKVRYTEEPKLALEGTVVSCSEAGSDGQKHQWALNIKFDHVNEERNRNLKLYISQLLLEQVGMHREQA
ncbi:MAG TPA: HAMP domain-containing sensor histidine kinase [Myxococcales bacterium]|nr:HAMP domain-containing sensor histidine kinase [Myxococcales bacterium]